MHPEGKLSLDSHSSTMYSGKLMALYLRNWRRRKSILTKNMVMKPKMSFFLILMTTSLYILSSVWLTNNYTTHFIKGTVITTEGDGDGYKNRLQESADKNGVVILALIDLGFVDFAVNFWETSIAPLGITNMLFVSVSRKACDILGSSGIPCHTYRDFSGGDSHSTYGTEVYLEKMNIRTLFILDALYWGFAVLNTDCDVIFFTNPLDSFLCDACDLEILEDSPGYLNAGFVYLRPYPATIKVYRQMALLAKEFPEVDDQRILNKVLKNMTKTVKFHTLDSARFTTGRKYYELPKRYFGDTAKECYQCKVVHNNWIVSKAAKIYRQREMLQWVYDGDQYYSNPNRKYLMYNNTIITNANDSVNLEISKQSLLNAFAIGKVLNRIVILPRLYCNGTQCPWNSHFNITHFEIYFGSEYRESTFLLNPKVPQTIKNSISENYVILSSYQNIKYVQNNLTVKRPKDTLNGATSDEIFKWFGNDGSAVLKFHTLHNAFKEFTDFKAQQDFEMKASEAFRLVTYRQRDIIEVSKCPKCL